MAKRSPRYPRQSLAKCVEQTSKLFDGAHQSRVDVDTAARILGYKDSSSGAAASTIGALRQFRLVDGLRGDLKVSDLALKIIQPMDARERAEAWEEAAYIPEIFGTILNQFNGKLPASDEPIKAFLIRQEGFSTNGANELIEVLRDTFNSLPENPSISKISNEKADKTSENFEPCSAAILREAEISSPQTAFGELITLPLGVNCKAELRFYGDVTPTAYSRLIRHLELLKDMLGEDQTLSPP